MKNDEVVTTMRNFISEDDIEQAILQKLEGELFQYGVLRCDPSPDKRELLPQRLLSEKLEVR